MNFPIKIKKEYIFFGKLLYLRHTKRYKMNPTEEANAEGHYLLITVAVIIGVTGVYLRFADFQYSNIIANVLLILGVAVALKAVFAILK
jgi:hypothetical protein